MSHVRIRIVKKQVFFAHKQKKAVPLKLRKTAGFLAKDTSLIQNAPDSLVSVCWVNTLTVSRLFRV